MDLSKQLEFYFGEVGEIIEDDEYIITNPDLLEDVSNNDQFAWLFDALNGNTWKALGETVANNVWNTVGQILSKTRFYDSKLAGEVISAYKFRRFW